jgi:hypothetical protein
MTHVRELIHVWHRCHGCGAAPIAGPRFDCQECPPGPDNTLCEPCYDAFRRGALAHPSPPGRDASRTPHVFLRAEGRSPSEFEHWDRVADAPAPAPPVPDRFVVRPELRVGPASFVGSYAFVAALGAAGPRYVITALHVLGELAIESKIDCSAANASYTGAELPRRIDRVELYDVFAAKWMFASLGYASSMLVLSGARIDEEEPCCQNDIAAFVPEPSAELTAVPIAETPPEAGEPIWLAVRTGGAERAIGGVVVERTGAAMIFRFAPFGESPRFSSGAPLVNRHGEVVGINVGAGAFDGRRYGHGVHAGSMRRHLESVAPPLSVLR